MQEKSSKRFVLAACMTAFLLVNIWGLGALEVGGKQALPQEEAPARTAQLGVSVGPDVTIIDLFGTTNYTNTFGGANPSPCPPGYGDGGEDCRGYSVGTNSCNIGSAPLDWCDQTSGCRETTDEWHPIAPATTSDHSVIAQNMYRLKDGRFTQIGFSFLKHGFLSLNTPDSDCAWNDGGSPNTSCIGPPAGGEQLGVGCTDFYSSGLNGSRPMGRRSDVQVAGANHPPNGAGGESDDDYDQRMVIPESYLDPAVNPGALYWVEGHYVVRDDARAGNGLNNASHRQALVGPAPSLNLTLTGPTIRELPAIFAWQAVDPDVDIVAVDKDTFFVGEEADPPVEPGEFYPDYTVTERFWAARRVTFIGGPMPYHYEYVIYNLNSDTSASLFEVDLGQTATIGNVGFHGLPHHSGEPYDTSDWGITVDGPNGRVVWRAMNVGANTNALRWGTAFSFWFDSDVGPSPVNHRLGTFKDSGSLNVPFGEVTLSSIFSDNFELGDPSAWTGTCPPDCPEKSSSK